MFLFDSCPSKNILLIYSTNVPHIDLICYNVHVYINIYMTVLTWVYSVMIKNKMLTKVIWKTHVINNDMRIQSNSLAAWLDVIELTLPSFQRIVFTRR